MLYLDPPRTVPKDHPTAPACFRGKPASHLLADSRKELLEYARSLGLKDEWLQAPGTYREHFDLTGRALEKALADERVRKVSVRELAALFQDRWASRKRRRRLRREVA